MMRCITNINEMTEINEQAENKPCIIHGVMQRFFNKIGWKIVQKTCKHKNKYNKWTDYKDRYYEDFCPDCRLTIYEGMD